MLCNGSDQELTDALPLTDFTRNLWASPRLTEHLVTLTSSAQFQVLTDHNTCEDKLWSRGYSICKSWSKRWQNHYYFTSSKTLHSVNSSMWLSPVVISTVNMTIKPCTQVFQYFHILKYIHTLKLPVNAAAMLLQMLLKNCTSTVATNAAGE